MSNWTPEPFNIRDAWDSTQKPFMSQDLLRRASVCVAACAGMEDPEKEIAALRTDNERLKSEKDALLDIIREPSCPSYDNLRADRQVLVDALESLAGLQSDWSPQSKIIREALAKVREKESTNG